jgi:hypothetical protein
VETNTALMIKSRRMQNVVYQVEDVRCGVQTGDASYCVHFLRSTLGSTSC